MPKVAFPASAEVVPEPLGVVLIFSSWNFPIGWYKALILVLSFQVLVEMETIRRARRRSTSIYPSYAIEKTGTRILKFFFVIVVVVVVVEVKRRK